MQGLPGSPETPYGAEDSEPRSALVFDDNPAINALVIVRLGKLGFSAEGVTEKNAFLAALDLRSPELIMLDLSLGDTDAVEVFGLLSARHYTGHLILMSGHSGKVLDHARGLAEASGMTIAGVLKKPFHQRDLGALVRQLGMVVSAPEVQPAAPVDLMLLHEALANDWLEFWYQAIIDLKKDCIIGAESLARIRHPVKGILPPASFLPQASDEDLNRLTLCAVEEACRACKTLNDRGRQHMLSVNVSARTFIRAGLIDDIRSIRDRYSSRLPIMLEMTETDFLKDKVAATAFATRAILHGFRVAIDDFGHGYATFARLRDTPFTELKLERLMVDGCANDPVLRKICQATVQLAHGFGAKCIAEGIEQSADLKVVRSLGFDMAQGYVFSPALPFEDFAQLPNSILAVPLVAGDGRSR